MLEVTNEAALYLCGLFSGRDSPEGAAVRLLLNEGKVRLTVDYQETNDLAYQLGGQTMLVLDKHVAKEVQHKTLDLKESDRKPELELT
jgi:hypothetical protein